MKVIPKKPIIGLSGKIGGLKAGWHARTIRKTGHVYLARNGNPCKNPPSPAQIANREQFAEAVRKRWRDRDAPKDTPQELRKGHPQAPSKEGDVG